MATQTVGTSPSTPVGCRGLQPMNLIDSDYTMDSLPSNRCCPVRPREALVLVLDHKQGGVDEGHQALPAGLHGNRR
jgi:hypothetical protein